jgi:putative hydrolase of the HAD superfamily
MTIQTVFFDMGGTIETFWYTRELRLKATPGLRLLLNEAGINLPLDDEKLLDLVSAGLKRYHELCIQQLDEYSTYRVWSEFILNGIPFDAEKLADQSEALMFYIETQFYQRSMRPEIPGVLETIQKMDLKIGLISNVNSRGQVVFNLEKYGLANYFDPVICSSQFGRRKPDPAIFHYAARLADTPTSQCLYVGDRIARDIVGARKAGFRLAIQIQHDFEHGEEDNGAIPDAVIENMTELVEIIKCENTQNGSISNHLDQVRAILFDAGDILYYRPERGLRLTQFLQEQGLQDAEIIPTEREELTQRAFRGQINQEEYREALLKLYGVTQPEQIERGKQVLEAEDNDVLFFEGVQETLLVLKEHGFLLGIVTDTANSVHSKLRWFESGGFGHVWDSIISSRELGTRKPDPIIFKAALQQLGLTASQAVFVGHKTSELDGARAVGMKTIAFNYDPNATADYYVNAFSEILNVGILNFEVAYKTHKSETL